MLYSISSERFKKMLRGQIEYPTLHTRRIYTMPYPQYPLERRTLDEPFKLFELWVTEDKNIVPIKQLATPHLKNILTYFEKNPSKQELATPAHYELLQTRLNYIRTVLSSREGNIRIKKSTVVRKINRALNQPVFTAESAELYDALRSAKQLILELSND